MRSAVGEEETQPQDPKDKEEQFRPNSGRNSKRGRPPESGSYRDIEDRTGIPRQTIKDAEQHVAAKAQKQQAEGLKERIGSAWWNLPPSPGPLGFLDAYSNT